jgi:hypothetical protein
VTATIRRGLPGSADFLETGSRFPMPKDIWPDEQVDLHMPFFLPEGTDASPAWVLDLVSEQVFWFSLRGTEAAEVEVAEAG